MQRSIRAHGNVSSARLEKLGFVQGLKCLGLTILTETFQASLPPQLYVTIRRLDRPSLVSLPFYKRLHLWMGLTKPRKKIVSGVGRWRWAVAVGGRQRHLAVGGTRWALTADTWRWSVVGISFNQGTYGGRWGCLKCLLGTLFLRYHRHCFYRRHPYAAHAPPTPRQKITPHTDTCRVCLRTRLRQCPTACAARIFSDSSSVSRLALG